MADTDTAIRFYRNAQQVVGFVFCTSSERFDTGAVFPSMTAAHAWADKTRADGTAELRKLVALLA